MEKRIFNEQPASLDELAHFGVKGMKWGVRKKTDSSSSNSNSASNTMPNSSTKQTASNRKAIARNVMIGAGILTVAAGAGFAVYQLNKNPNLLRSNLPQPKKAVTDFVKEQQPVGIIHAARGKHAGFHFPRGGGLSDPLREYDKAEFDSLLDDSLHRYGANREKIAAKFFDPEGRKDFAGRKIFHQVIVPSSMTEGINDIEDVKTKLWPLLKDDYDQVYNRGEDEKGYKRFD